MIERKVSLRQDEMVRRRDRGVRKRAAASILEPLVREETIGLEEGQALFSYFGKRWNIRTIASSLGISEEDAIKTIKSIFRKLPRETQIALRQVRRTEISLSTTNYWEQGGYKNPLLQPFLDNGTLHPGQAQVIYLRCQQGLLPSQIADKLQIDRLSVKKQIRNGLKKLPKEIAQELRRIRGD